MGIRDRVPLTAEVSTSGAVICRIMLEIATLERPSTLFNGNLCHVETTDYQTMMSFFGDWKLFSSLEGTLFILAKCYASVGHALSDLLIERFQWE